MTDGPGFEGIEVSLTKRVAVLALASNKVNALDAAVLNEIESFVEICEEDPEVGALVLTGEGTTFSAGLNVKRILASEKSYVGELLESFERALLRLFHCPMPTVAAINGPAVAAGCLLACACDRRLIAQDAHMGVTELHVGVSIGVKTVDLLRQVCGHHAERLMVDAELVDADEACRSGLAHESFRRSDLRAAAVSMAEQLASLDRGAYGLAKEAARRQTFSGSDDQHNRALERRSRDRWRSDAARVRLERLVGSG